MLKIVYKSPQELKIYKNNPRFNENAVDVVAKSIKKYGFLVPILINDKDLIISGDTRRKAAIKLNIDKIPCIYIEGLTDEQLKAFRLVENKTSEFAKWDIDKLISELSEITDADLFETFDFPNINIDEFDVKDEDFLLDTGIVKNKEKKKVKCPKCGEEFEV